MIYVKAFVGGAYHRAAYEVKIVRKRRRVYHKLTKLS